MHTLMCKHVRNTVWQQKKEPASAIKQASRQIPTQTPIHLHKAHTAAHGHNFETLRCSHAGSSVPAAAGSSLQCGTTGTQQLHEAGVGAQVLTSLQGGPRVTWVRGGGMTRGRDEAGR